MTFKVFSMHRIFFHQRTALFFILSALVLFTSGCTDDEERGKKDPIIYSAGLYENKIKIENILNVPEAVEFDKIRVVIRGEGWKNIDTLEFPNQHKEINLMLPTQFAWDQLQKVDRQNNDIWGYWPAISNNPSARVATLDDIIAYNGETKVGRIYLSNLPTELSSLKKIFIYYQYTTEPFSLTGSNSSYYYSECSFEKGWNAFAYINPAMDNDLGKARCTTSIPSEFNLCWFFESWVY